MHQTKNAYPTRSKRSIKRANREGNKRSRRNILLHALKIEALSFEPTLSLQTEKPKIETLDVKISVADPDPRSGAFLTPGSGIRIRDRKK
jgi:hypothetical protein